MKWLVKFPDNIGPDDAMEGIRNHCAFWFCGGFFFFLALSCVVFYFTLFFFLLFFLFFLLCHFRVRPATSTFFPPNEYLCCGVAPDPLVHTLVDFGFLCFSASSLEGGDASRSSLFRLFLEQAFLPQHFFPNPAPFMASN